MPVLREKPPRSRRLYRPRWWPQWHLLWPWRFSRLHAASCAASQRVDGPAKSTSIWGWRRPTSVFSLRGLEEDEREVIGEMGVEIFLIDNWSYKPQCRKERLILRPTNSAKSSSPLHCWWFYNYCSGVICMKEKIVKSRHGWKRLKYLLVSINTDLSHR